MAADSAELVRYSPSALFSVYIIVRGRLYDSIADKRGRSRLIMITIIMFAGRPCSRRRMSSLSVRRQRVPCSGRAPRRRRVNFESDVEPHAIDHQLRYQCVFFLRTTHAYCSLTLCIESSIAQSVRIKVNANAFSGAQPASNPVVSFFFDTSQMFFKVPTSVDLTYCGFEVIFSTESTA